jgi:hypothetical protein
VVVDYDQSTALVVVDVQNDFADPKGSLYVGEGERVVPLVNREIQQALAVGALVVYTQDWHPAAQTPHFQSGGGVWPEHCVQHTWGAQLHPDLQVAGEVVRNGQGGRTATRASPPRSADRAGGFGNRSVILTLTGAQLQTAFLNGFTPFCDPAFAGGTGRWVLIRALAPSKVLGRRPAEIRSLVCDARRVEAGALFVCVPACCSRPSS